MLLHDVRDLAAKLVGVAGLYGWRERDRKCRVFGPLRIFGVEVYLRAFCAQRAAADLVYKHLRSWPFTCVLYEARDHWVREGVGYLLHQSIPCYQVYHARRPVIPNRALPRAQNLGPERDKTMELLKKAWKLATGVGDNKMKVRGHHAKRMYENTMAMG
ncbi:hypothetical protein BE08_16175 [Sorangium cellulosum]|uniref:Uncharacterized protein n=1 Tax=Sorangium cellulosum TaxID=56 RepID=A0A150PSB5_SORCE|nr:hypothetical protein BE08_16175 [Sorangium cellulosum]